MESKKSGNVLYVLNVLKKYSDCNHILSRVELESLIEKEYGVKIERKTLGNYIKLLKNKFNVDISDWNDNGIGYYYIKDPEQEFEVGELKTIIDTFSYATFIDSKTSLDIIEKCKNIYNIYDRKKLTNYKVYSDKIKTTNKEVIMNIEEISDSIYNKNKIKFDYYKYKLNPNLEFEFVKEALVSPYAIIYSIQELYLVALKDGDKKLKTYRIDRIKNVRKFNEPVSSIVTDKDIDELVSSTISMYGSKGEDIEAIIDNKLLDNVIEVFGSNSDIKKYDNEHFILRINKDLDGFKRYVLRNLDYIRIVKPDKLKDKVNKILKDYLSKE